MTFEDAFRLAKAAAEAGIDFSDGTIHQDRSLSAQWYGTSAVILEVVSNLFQEYVWSNQDLFTQDEISEMLG